MSKFKAFFDKVNDDDTAKKEFIAILGDKTLSEATDEQLSKMSELSRRLGADITAEEMKAFSGDSEELDDDELTNVNGGYVLHHDHEKYYLLYNDRTGAFEGVFMTYEEAKAAAKRLRISAKIR